MTFVTKFGSLLRQTAITRKIGPAPAAVRSMLSPIRCEPTKVYVVGGYIPRGQGYGLATFSSKGIPSDLPTENDEEDLVSKLRRTEEEEKAALRKRLEDSEMDAGKVIAEASGFLDSVWSAWSWSAVVAWLLS